MSMAVGMAVLDVIEREGLVQHARNTGDTFLQELKLLKERHTSIGDVRWGCGVINSFYTENACVLMQYPA